MPGFMQRWKRGRFRRKRWLRKANRWVWNTNANLLGYGAHLAGGPALASVAKRFFKSLGAVGSPLSINSLSIGKTILSEIPVSITGTNPQVQDRVGRKIFIKGVTLVLRVQSTIASAPQTIRVTLVRQSDPSETSSATSMYGPFGATSGQQVLYDRYIHLDTLNAAQSNDGRQIKKYIKVNKTLLFEGDQTNGTDTDEGTIVLYQQTDDSQGYNSYGGSTIHYRELL